MIRIALGWSAAVVSTTVACSLIQTQINLAALARIDAPVSLGERLATSGFDLIHFAPLWAVLVALGLLPAFLIAGALARRWPLWRPRLFPLAGASAVLTILGLMALLLPVTVIAAARSTPGCLLLAAGGALGGWVYLQIVPQRQKGAN